MTNVKSRFRKMSSLAAVLFLSIIILLTGCGAEEEKVEATPTPTPEVAEHERALEVVDGTMSADSTVIAVGQTPVSYREYLTYYHFMENQYDSLLGEEVWKQRVESDKTIGQVAIEDVLRLIIQVKVIVKQAEHLGVALEADEKEDADYSAQKYYDSMSEADRQDSMITAAQIMKVFEENRLSKKVYNVITGQVDSTLNLNETQAYRVQLLYKKAGDDNREKVRADMDSLQKTIASSDKSFYYYAKRETEADEVECIIGALDERKNLWNTIIALKIGTISPVVEETDGFYIVNVLARPDVAIDTEYQNRVVSERQTEAFQNQYKEWSACYDVDVSDSLLSD